MLPTKKSLAFVWLVLSQCMVAINIVATKALIPYLHPYVILLFRFSIATIFLIVLQCVRHEQSIQSLKQQTVSDWFIIIIQALCAGFLFNSLMLIGLHHATASMAGMMASALPAIVVILSVVLLRLRLTWSMTGCVLLALLGLIIMNMPQAKAASVQWFGDAMVLLSLLPEGLYYILAKRYTIKMPMFFLAALLNAINIPILFMVVWLKHDVLTVYMSAHVWMLLCFAGFSSAFFYIFWSKGCKDVHGVAVGLSTAVMPIATIIIAFICLQEAVHFWQYIGMIVVILSIVVHALAQRKGRSICQK